MSLPLTVHPTGQTLHPKALILRRRQIVVNSSLCTERRCGRTGQLTKATHTWCPWRWEMVPKDGIHPVEVVDEGEAGGHGHQPLDRRSISSSSSSSSSSARLYQHPPSR